ncbi:hypothetical protein HID58_088570 [Brassica napus]|uniref:Uncharacterized protein n=1 Tax=Brassica napus TaxID=3708 RepID=A0ABQ7XXY2_BRANA|nr:hypothetical protein HID58_088570 [Brassica napus]
MVPPPDLSPEKVLRKKFTKLGPWKCLPLSQKLQRFVLISLLSSLVGKFVSLMEFQRTRFKKSSVLLLLLLNP